MGIPVGVLGATTPIGWQLCRLLDDHDTFEIAALTATDDTPGSSYRAVLDGDDALSDSLAETTLRPTSPPAISDDIELLVSALPVSVAQEAEPAFAGDDYLVVSTAKNERLARDVPLVIPAVNPNQLALLDRQRDSRGWEGALVKTPSAATVGLTLPLAVLDAFGVESATVATLQGVESEAAARDLTGNAVPRIRGQRSRLTSEPPKILGSLDDGEISHRELDIAPSCNRVPTRRGQLLNVWLDTTTQVSPIEAEATLREAAPVDLPSAPSELFRVFVDASRPQPALDSDIADGQGFAVGPVEPTPDGIQFDCLVNEAVRGGAGTTLLTAELLVREGHTARPGFPNPL